ncbi:NIPSNAP family containing protein [Niabella ginsenosidivorans]|uniref:NIPSNAP family containing protein n=1 Tax=Niabella ginsenosidivorans TaxID=1176587 RepID=A0A1A9I538_9BACT|nr:NIPSNAP family protein [Niabella ginsenosidivorans]ANH82673.1 NIPSNAP family containing protein [Niabella ginsenosidivorans]
MKQLFTGILLLLIAPSIARAQRVPAVREYYQLTVYHYSTTRQEEELDRYLQNALVPALHKLRLMRVGVFKALDNDTALQKKIYVLIPFRGLEQWSQLDQRLLQDNGYRHAAGDYMNAPNKAGAYDRMETILMRSFSGAPTLEVPQLKGDKNDRVYELRSYESTTEKQFRSKVKMFNAGNEIGIFKRLGFNAVFYGEVLAGCRMPNLMYMTTHENRAAREQNWKNFGNDRDWKNLNLLEEYKDNVSHIDVTFLKATPYSDL